MWILNKSKNKIRLELANSKLDEQLEYRDDLNAKINDLETKLDLIIDHLINKRKLSIENESSMSPIMEDTSRTKVNKLSRQKSLAIPDEQLISIDKKTNQYPNSNVVIFEVDNTKKSWKIKY